MDLLKKIINIQNPYIIAEAGVNHECDLDKAYLLIDEAKEGGADAIKFQTYKASKIASKNSPSYWDLKKEKTSSQYQLFSKYDKFWKKDFEKLKKRCDELEIEFMSTPFDIVSAKFLNDLMRVFKISSSDLNNTPFIEFICNFQKPVILSTGASTSNEIENSVKLIETYGCEVAILHCVLSYPTKLADANLGIISYLKKKFPKNVIGYSDHTSPNVDVLSTAYLLGAQIIEKHFTFNKLLPGNDHYHSMDKSDLIKLKKKLIKIKKIIGENKRVILPAEEMSRLNARRSIVANKKIKKNQVITINDLTWKRPGTGIPPNNINLIINKKAKVDISADSIITWDMIF